MQAKCLTGASFNGWHFPSWLKKTEVHVDGWVICATHLAELVQKACTREDLAYRLNVLTLTRCRRYVRLSADIMPLTELPRRLRRRGRVRTRPTPEYRVIGARYAAGNVRGS